LARAQAGLGRVVEEHDAAGDRTGAAEALAARAEIQVSTGDHAGAEADLRRAAGLFEEGGDLAGRLGCRVLSAAVALGRGNAAEALRLAEEPARLARGETAARALTLRALAWTRTGRYADVQKPLQEALRVARAGGLRRVHLAARLAEAELYFTVGAFTGALAGLAEVEAAAAAARDPELEVAALIGRARVLAGTEQGPAGAAAELARGACARLARSGMRPLALAAHLAAAAALAAVEGQVGAAAEHAEAALDLAEALGAEAALAQGLYLQGVLLAPRATSHSVAERVLARAGAVARRLELPELLWRVLLAEARLARAAGRPADASGREREIKEILYTLRGRAAGALGVAFWEFPERRRAAAALGIDA
ncbi:MAG: hypothetical protein HZA54_00055, partial [Planctomycetes bacterium]|nr:hypothetical protein [Planctomycetota bacterium]